MKIRHEVLPFLLIAALLAIGIWGLLRWRSVSPGLAGGIPLCFFAILGAYLLWFFRNPDRSPAAIPDAIWAPADGVIANVTVFPPDRFTSIRMLAGLKSEDTRRLQNTDVVRISIFLSLMDVHVNRIPIAGQSRFLGYFPGKHIFTFKEKSSDENQHNSILVESPRTACLMNQIVGPVCRRVVYWLDPVRPVSVQAGEPFGMMKFGSRLDLYFPAADVEITARTGDRVSAGLTQIGKVR